MKKVRIVVLATNIKDKMSLMRLLDALKNHLMSDTHTDFHKMCCGLGMMCVGVCVSKVQVELALFHFFFDGLGYGIHGIGLTPFVNKLASLHDSTPKVDVHVTPTNNKDDTRNNVDEVAIVDEVVK